MKTRNCRVCNVVLDSENWHLSRQKKKDYICKECKGKQKRLWQTANPDKAKAMWTRDNRKRGIRSFNKNKKCSSYLGIHIAERVMSKVFKNIKRMPMNNPGYDVICNRNKLIDIKSSCLRGTKYPRWLFMIRRNHIADFFLCLAFNNREDIQPIYAWLIPGSKLNHLKGAGITQSTIHKWDAYKLDITKISTCCDHLREESGRIQKPRIRGFKESLTTHR